MTLDRQHWWEEHSNLVLLTTWLADNGHSAATIAYAVEKPWKYVDEFEQAFIEQQQVSSN